MTNQDELKDNSQNLAVRSFNAASWTLIIKFLDQFLHIFYGILMVRYLEPSDFGVLGMLSIFWAVANLFIEGGFSDALIQKKNITKIDLCSVFYYNVVLSFICCFIMLGAAPNIADFYSQPILSETIRVSAWMLPISSLGAIQRVVLCRKLQQQKISIARLCSFLISSFIAVTLAFNGFGVWSLVWFQFSSMSVNAIMLIILVHWMPSLIFSIKSLASHFKYGSKLLIAGLFDCLFGNAYSLIIGKCFNAESLGYFEQARKYSSLWPLSVQDSVTFVLFPAFSKIHDDIDRLHDAFRRSLSLSVLVISFPSMLLATLSYPLVVVVLTPKWLPVIPFWFLLTYTYLLFPFNALNLQLLKARGHSTAFLVLSVIRRCFTLLNIWITYRYSLMAMVIGMTICSSLSLVINTYFTGKEIKYSLFTQIKDNILCFILSLISCLSAYFCYLIIFPVSRYAGVILPVIWGVTIYFISNYILQTDPFVDLITILKRKIPFMENFLRIRTNRNNNS